MMGEHPNQTSVDAIEAQERRWQALEWRKKGLSYREIAKRLKCHHTTAYEHVVRALEDLKSTTLVNADALRELEVQRLDRWEKSLQMGLKEPEGPNRAKVVATLIKLAESRRKLLGLDAPQKVEMSGNLYSVRDASPDCEEWGQPAKGGTNELPAMREGVPSVEGGGDEVAAE